MPGAAVVAMGVCKWTVVDLRGLVLNSPCHSLSLDGRQITVSFAGKSTLHPIQPICGPLPGHTLSSLRRCGVVPLAFSFFFSFLLFSFL